MGRIAVIGMSNTDLVCRAPRLPLAGETLPGYSFNTFAGGKGANQAVAAARSGAKVTFGGAVGNDAYGDARLSDLRAVGIDVTAVQTLMDTASGVAIIVVGDDGENQIVTVAGANYELRPQSLVDHLSSLDLDLVLMTWDLHPDASRAIVAAVSPDLPLVINTAPFDESLRGVFPDERLVVIANEVEAGQLLGYQVIVDGALDAARAMLAMGCRAAVITIGAAGAVFAVEGGAWSVPSPKVQVVDTTGAGDAFCGAFAAWLSDGASLLDAVTAGVHAGSCAVTRPGAQPSLPTKDEIMSSMARQSR